MCIYTMQLQPTTQPEVQTPVEMLREATISYEAYSDEDRDDTTFEPKTTNFYFD